MCDIYQSTKDFYVAHVLSTFMETIKTDQDNAIIYRQGSQDA